MKVGKRAPRGINRIEFSKEFLAEFGLLPNNKEALAEPQNNNDKKSK